MTSSTMQLPEGARSSRPVQALDRPPMWYRDTVSCLQATIGSVLAYRGHDPLEILGAGWDFTHIPGEPPFEEFYLPSPPGISAGQSLAPHHPLSVRWAAGVGDDPLGELSDAIEIGQLPIVALDKYHLPFRPAYHDIHAAYLLVVYGVDKRRGLVLVSDSTPPHFTGPIAAEPFLAAWHSRNPADEQDAFFSESEISARYLVVELRDRISPLTRSQFGAALCANMVSFRAEGSETVWTGVAGLQRFLTAVHQAAVERDLIKIRQVYPFAWSSQAKASLHGELLRLRGAQWSVPELMEAGRAVEMVAHTWTALRVTAAHNWRAPDTVADIFSMQAQRLLSRHEAALEMISLAAERLEH